MAKKDKYAVTLAIKVANARANAGLSQTDLATRAGFHLSRITHIEQGITTDPKWSTMCKLAKALGVSLDDLVGD